MSDKESLDVLDAIRGRRSIKRFADRPVSREQIEALIEAAVLAPNHRMTEPWRFYVLGPRARRAFGEVLGARKARKVEDPEAARLVREKVAAEHEGLPAMLAVAMVQDDNPEIREEDYASTMMAIQNLALAASAVGLGTHIKSGAVMDDPGARAAIGVAAGERVVATIPVGVPAEIPSPKARTAASNCTVWLD
ncbi:MAG: nitroreductase [Gemmatimonadota bacterium]